MLQILQIKVALDYLKFTLVSVKLT